jgi:hypothetical protein
MNLGIFRCAFWLIWLIAIERQQKAWQEPGFLLAQIK